MLRGRKAYERGEFIASTDERFRPVYLSSAPDGTLYLVDMYHGIIQHKGYITEYLRDQILSRQARAPAGARPHLPHRARPRRSAARNRRCPRLEGAAARRRARASERLVARQGAAAARRAWRSSSAMPALKEKRRARAETGGRGCTRCGRSTASTRSSRRRSRRRSTIRRATCGCRRFGSAERWLTDAKQPDPAGGAEEARRQGLGGAPAARGEPRRAAGCRADPGADDPARAARRRSDHGGCGGQRPAGQRARRCCSGFSRPPGRRRSGPVAAVVLAATLVRGGEDARVQELLSAGGSAGPPGVAARWRCSRAPRRRCSARPLPGSGRRGAGAGRGAAPAAAATSAAPGGRAGPGGAPAFPGVRPSDAPAAGRGRGNTAAVPLTREPAPLVALASAGGETGKRAAALARALDVAGQAGRGRSRAGRGAADRGGTEAVRRRQDRLHDALRRVPPTRTAKAGTSWGRRSSARPLRSLSRTCRCAS